MLKFWLGNLRILDLKQLNEESPNGIKLLIEENVDMRDPTLAKLWPRMWAIRVLHSVARMWACSGMN
jgi:hypothetical protein